MRMSASVDCPRCKVRGSSPCRTIGGKIADWPHLARRRVESPRMLKGDLPKDRIVKSRPEQTATSQAKTADHIKLAMWFISKVGGIESARRAFGAARAALESYEQTEQRPAKW